MKNSEPQNIDDNIYEKRQISAIFSFLNAQAVS